VLRFVEIGKLRTAALVALVGFAGAALARAADDPDDPAPASESDTPAPTPAKAPSALRLRGRVSEDVDYRLPVPNDFSMLRTTAWLDGKYSFSEAVNLRVGVRGWYDGVFDATHQYPAPVERDQETEIALREALLTASLGKFDIRAGRQQIVWGEALGAFVTDIVNPRDLRQFLLPDFAELRMPLWALDLTYRPFEGVRVEGVWTPERRFHKLAQPGGEFQITPPAYQFRNPVVLQKDDAEGFGLGKSEGGVHVSALIKGWDLSALYFTQADKLPLLYQDRLRQPAGPDIISLEPRHPRLQIVGATLAKTFEPVVVRAEAAYTFNKWYPTIDPTVPGGIVRRDTLNYLVGMDYTVAKKVDTTLQVSQQVLAGPTAGLTSSTLEGRVTTSVALRLASGFRRNTLNPTVLFVVNTNRGDYRISPRLDWLVAGAFTLSIGGNWFGGHPDTLYGEFDTKDHLFVSTTWRF
jgi:hypothetical protein